MSTEITITEWPYFLDPLGIEEMGFVFTNTNLRGLIHFLNHEKSNTWPHKKKVADFLMELNGPLWAKTGLDMFRVQFQYVNNAYILSTKFRRTNVSPKIYRAGYTLDEITDKSIPQLVEETLDFFTNNLMVHGDFLMESYEGRREGERIIKLLSKHEGIYKEYCAHNKNHSIENQTQSTQVSITNMGGFGPSDGYNPWIAIDREAQGLARELQTSPRNGF